VGIELVNGKDILPKQHFIILRNNFGFGEL